MRTIIMSFPSGTTLDRLSWERVSQELWITERGVPKDMNRTVSVVVSVAKPMSSSSQSFAEKGRETENKSALVPT